MHVRANWKRLNFKALSGAMLRNDEKRRAGNTTGGATINT